MVNIEQFHQELWAKIKESLSSQMTQATFNLHIRPTYSIAFHQGRWQIGVNGKASQEWLEQNRLYQIIHRATAGVVKQQVEFEFVVAGSNDRPVKAGDDDEAITGSSAPDEGQSLEPETDAGAITGSLAPDNAQPSDPAVIFAQTVNFHTVKMQMGRWLTELQYDSLFWQPFLGSQSWQLYRHLLIYWTKNLRKKEMRRLDMENPDHHWTTPFRLSCRKATGWLGKRNQKIIPGGMYECHTSDIHHRLLKQPLTGCCGTYTPHDWQPAGPDGEGRCYYWRAGKIHVLYDAHLLTIEISNTGRMTVQVWRNLPLLTPDQVGRLSPFLQDEHERWLEKHLSLYGDWTLEQWHTFSQLSLVPLMPGYDAGRRLFGRPPENPLLKKGREA